MSCVNWGQGSRVEPSYHRKPCAAIVSLCSTCSVGPMGIDWRLAHGLGDIAVVWIWIRPGILEQYVMIEM